MVELAVWLSSNTLDRQFIFSYSLTFLFVPCGRLSWLSVCFLLHVKYTVSYRTPSPVSTWMGNRLRASKPSRCRTTQVFSAWPSLLGIVAVNRPSTNKSWETGTPLDVTALTKFRGLAVFNKLFINTGVWLWLYGVTYGKQ